MRYLGIDYGTKKIGIALSDERGTMGFPHAVISNDGRALEGISALAKEKGIGCIVIGESRDFKGNENAVAPEAKKFAETLETILHLPIEWEPEFLTSAAARRAPGAPDEKQSRSPKERGMVDDSAAALILTSYLSRHPR